MAQKPRLSYITQSFRDQPSFDTAISRALLELVAAGKRPPTLRLARPAAMVAFGRQDVASKNYKSAIRAAERAGFSSVERLAGGRAAVFHHDTVALAFADSDPHPPSRIYERFQTTAEFVTAALRELGVDARIGAVGGEYCPGAYSINARAKTKLAGLGQRLVAGGAHVGGVVVVSRSDLVRQALEPVYEALGIGFDPTTVGSIADEIADADFERVREAIVSEFADRYELVETTLDPETLELAARLEPQHRAPSSRARGRELAT